MFSLIKNELFKIFHKKSTKVLLLIMLGFVLLTNIIYKNSKDYYGRINDYRIGYNEAKDFINNNEINKDNYEDYVYYETYISVVELKDKYKEDWQVEVIDSEFYQLYYQYYLDNYFSNQDNIIKDEELIDSLLKDLDSGNWQNFVNARITNLKNELQTYKIELNENTSKRNELELKKSIEVLEKEIELYEYRIKENLPIGGHTYLDDAINVVNGSKYEVINAKYSNIDKYDFANALKDYHINEYILDNKVDVDNDKSTRGLLIDFYVEYDFLILVFVIMIAGSLVSDEYSKGTIKSLLILPYKRFKILLAKLLTMVIMILFGIFALFTMQLVVGSIFFGLSSLSIPFVTYNIATESIVTMNIFKYFIVVTIAIIPRILLLGTLAFAISTVIGNTAAAIAITFCGYVGEVIVNTIAMRYNVEFLNYFVTTNWNFQELLFGGRNHFGLSLTHSIIVCSIYFILMVVVSFIVFKKKDIKNI